MNKILLTTVLSVVLGQVAAQAGDLYEGGSYSTAGTLSTTYGASTANVHGALWVTAGTTMVIAANCKDKTDSMREFSECVVYDTFDAAMQTIEETWRVIRDEAIPYSEQMLKNAPEWTTDGPRGTTDASGKITDRMSNKKEAEKAAAAAFQKDLLNVAAGFDAENEVTSETVNAIVEKSASLGAIISPNVAAMMAYNALAEKVAQ